MKLNSYSAGNGQGPALIVLHGLLGSLSNWKSAAARWAANFPVRLLDLRNHGSSPHAAEFNYDVMVADVVEFVREQNLGRINLLGHSLGGKVAMRFAQLHPGLVAKLVVADMAPRAYPVVHAELLAALLAIEPGAFHNRADVEAALARTVPDQRMRQFLLKNLGRDEAGALRWQPDLAAIRAALPQLSAALPRTPRFDGPVLILRGEKSDYLRDEDMLLIREMFPRANLETIAGAGHWVHADAPARFAEVVSGFITGEK